MYKLSGCPKCGGDLAQEKDEYGPYVHCLQCGCHPGEQLVRPSPIRPIDHRFKVWKKDLWKIEVLPIWKVKVRECKKEKAGV